MATPTELSVLLRLYTSKQNSPTVIIQDFCDYLQKYARHYMQEAPELVRYLDDTINTVQKEIDALEVAGKVIIAIDVKNRKTVFVPQFFIDRMIQRYRDLEDRPEVPFPLSAELPQGFPPTFLKPIYITSDFAELIESGERTNTHLNQLIFPDETPPLVYPPSLSPEKLLDLALAKIRLFLHKDESRDFIQKRMMIANPGKELTIKNQLTQFQTRPSESQRALKHAGEAFLFFSYLCSFIRQDFSKKNDKTPEEITLIQAVYITEYLNNYYKNRAQADLQRETALKNLELCFQKPPYYYDMETISRFTDSRGVPLLGQYKNTDLDSFIKERTAESSSSMLPLLLVFKTANGNRYFLLKEKVVPLAVKLCNDSRKVIKDSLTREWFQLLCNYRQEGAMKNQADFERKLEALCKSSAPMLHALLTASFVPLLPLEAPGAEADVPNGFKMFDRGKLLPWSELLMLDRQELLTDTRIMLPFWYTIPILSSIVAFFRRPRAAKEQEKRPQAQAVEELEAAPKGKSSKEIRDQRKTELRGAAQRLERKFVPEGSTLENEMSAQLDLWNRTLNPQVKDNLTEDVNSLVRDYVRRIIKSIKASTFDAARVENLAQTLVDTPSLIKIKNRDALVGYVELYIIHLIRNIA
ncbi:MAG TPA: hypothetical protein PKL75_07425 [Treponemataceae bacterium]|nr:hypothetical protein [Treponemataceae bacterium]